MCSLVSDAGPEKFRELDSNQRIPGFKDRSGMPSPHPGMEPPAGVEPAASRLQGDRSVQVSYGGKQSKAGASGRTHHASEVIPDRIG